MTLGSKHSVEDTTGRVGSSAPLVGAARRQERPLAGS
jgi:hypothetical protein